MLHFIKPVWNYLQKSAWNHIHSKEKKKIHTNKLSKYTLFHYFLASSNATFCSFSCVCDWRNCTRQYTTMILLLGSLLVLYCNANSLGTLTMSLDMLKNFCFHVYAQKSLSLYHTLALSHSLILSFTLSRHGEWDENKTCSACLEDQLELF